MITFHNAICCCCWFCLDQTHRVKHATLRFCCCCLMLSLMMLHIWPIRGSVTKLSSFFLLYGQYASLNPHHTPPATETKQKLCTHTHTHTRQFERQQNFFFWRAIPPKRQLYVYIQPSNQKACIQFLIGLLDAMDDGAVLTTRNGFIIIIIISDHHNHYQSQLIES